MQGLGDLPGGEFSSFAYDINNAGQVVGYSVGTSGREAFLWTEFAGMQSLNDAIDPNSGWALATAWAINASGQIVGTGINPDGFTEAFLLTPTTDVMPVPVPATLPLLGAAILAFVALHRRGRRSGMGLRVV